MVRVAQCLHRLPKAAHRAPSVTHLQQCCTLVVHRRCRVTHRYRIQAGQRCPLRLSRCSSKGA
jgi:hypothetical protein